jgi:ribosomal protein S18 acetylase RimI-like enzyme
VLFARTATPDDEPFLWRMLAHASWAAPDEDVRRVPHLQRYVAGWGRPGDLGVIGETGDAEQADEGGTVSGARRPVGAAWLRLPTEDDRGNEVFVASDVAELSVAVEPDRRGTGLGGRLVSELLDRARADGRYAGIVLSTRMENPAVRLYQRLGFVQKDVIVNRVGGSSRRMILGLPSVSGQTPRPAQNPE